jgi:hypothetical protein
MQPKRFPYSGFLRGPGAVLPAVEVADVVLERRDGDNLVLSTVSRVAAMREGFDIGAGTLRSMARRHVELLAEALRDEQPWISWLPEDDQVACVRELTDGLAASLDSGSFVRFHNDLVAWRDTAEAWADPDLAVRLGGSFAGDAGEVRRPGST